MRKLLVGKRGFEIQSGQALLEVALLLPLLLVLILGAIDFGRVFTTKIVLTNAAREGVYYLTINPPTDSSNSSDASYIATRTLVKTEASNQGISVNDSDIAITNCCTSGSAVRVSVSKNANLIFGNVLFRFGLAKGPIVLTRSVQMMMP